MALKSISNKGTISFNMLKTGFIDFLFIIIVVFTFMFLSSSFYDVKLQTYSTEVDIFVNRLLYSPTTFTYVDPITQRPYPGIWDARKLTEENLKNTVDYKDNTRFMSARVTVFGLQPIYLNKDTHDKLNPVRNIEGLGASFGKTYRYKMILLKDGKKQPVDVEIDVLIPKS